MRRGILVLAALLALVVAGVTVTFALRYLRTGSGYAVPTELIELLTAGSGGNMHPQQYPGAAYHNGVVYFVYLADSGNVEIRTYTEATRTVSAATVLHAALSTDGHASPVVHIRHSDQRIMVFYAPPSDTDEMYLRVSTSPEDISAFAAEVNLHTAIGASDYTYPNVQQLSGEAGDPIYLFFRSDNSAGTPGTRASITYSKVADADSSVGANWSAATKIHAPTGERPYWVIRSNGVDRIDFFTSKTDRAFNSNVPGAHFYYSGGAYFKSDGTSAGALPLDYTDMTEVYDGTLGSVDPNDIAYDASGNPIVTFGLYESNPGTRADVIYRGVWDSGWTVEQVADDAAWSAIDPHRPHHLYLRKLVAGVYEVWKYVKGVTWTGTALTTGTTGTQGLPLAVRNRAGLTAIWEFVDGSGNTGVNGALR